MSSNNQQNDNLSVNAMATSGTEKSKKSPVNKKVSRKRSFGQFCKNCGAIMLDDEISSSPELSDCLCVENSMAKTQDIMNRSARSQWGQIMLYRR